MQFNIEVLVLEIPDSHELMFLVIIYMQYNTKLSFNEQHIFYPSKLTFYK
jgi:hypothetical protein